MTFEESRRTRRVLSDYACREAVRLAVRRSSEERQTFLQKQCTRLEGGNSRLASAQLDVRMSFSAILISSRVYCANAFHSLSKGWLREL